VGRVEDLWGSLLPMSLSVTEVLSMRKAGGLASPSPAPMITS